MLWAKNLNEDFFLRRQLTPPPGPRRRRLPFIGELTGSGLFLNNCQKQLPFLRSGTTLNSHLHRAYNSALDKIVQMSSLSISPVQLSTVGKHSFTL